MTERPGDVKTTFLSQNVPHTSKSVKQCQKEKVCWWCGERPASHNLSTNCDRCWFYNKHQFHKMRWEDHDINECSVCKKPAVKPSTEILSGA